MINSVINLPYASIKMPHFKGVGKEEQKMDKHTEKAIDTLAEQLKDKRFGEFPQVDFENVQNKKMTSSISVAQDKTTPELKKIVLTVSDKTSKEEVKLTLDELEAKNENSLSEYIKSADVKQKIEYELSILTGINSLIHDIREHHMVFPRVEFDNTYRPLMKNILNLGRDPINPESKTVKRLELKVHWRATGDGLRVNIAEVGSTTDEKMVDFLKSERGITTIRHEFGRLAAKLEQK